MKPENTITPRYPKDSFWGLCDKVFALMREYYATDTPDWRVCELDAQMAPIMHEMNRRCESQYRELLYMVGSWMNRPQQHQTD